MLKSSRMKKLVSREPKEHYKYPRSAIQGTISEQTSEMEEKNEQTRAALTVDSPGHPVHL